MSKVVLVTGASSGIGRATALGFAKHGARLVLGSRREDFGAALLREQESSPERADRCRPDLEGGRAPCRAAEDRAGRSACRQASEVIAGARKE
jgi:NAD(P)-dependent dehydrogenase (short-subunit alcohol dehydrogenase family)